MNSYAPNAANENFPDKQSLENVFYEKTRDERDSTRQEHQDIFHSRRAEGKGKHLSGTGKILRGVLNKSGNDEDAFFFGGNWSLALMMLAQPLVVSWDGAKDLFKSAYSNLTASTALSSSHAPARYSPDLGPIETQHVSTAFLQVVNAYEKEQVENAEIHAKSTFNGLSQGFKVYAPHITQAYNDALDNTQATPKINSEIAKHNLETVILEQNGICFSTEHNKHIICATKLNDLREAFRQTPRNNDLGSNPILVFRQATQTITPNLPQPIEVGLRTLQPALTPLRF